MVGEIVETITMPDDTILDPFCGSGTVLLEGALRGRNVIGIDSSKYAVVLSRGKLEAPTSRRRLDRYMSKLHSEFVGQDGNVDAVPEYVARMFHPQTMMELLCWRSYLLKHRKHFLLSCLLGRLHHRRMSAFSYPASHHTPFLLDRLFPRSQYPDMYEFRPVLPRLLAKVNHAMAHAIPVQYYATNKIVKMGNAMHVPLEDESVDCVITCPPYGTSLDYGRDNRVRLWFSGRQDWRKLDNHPKPRDFPELVTRALAECHRVLKKGGYLALIIGDGCKGGEDLHTLAAAEIARKYRVLATIRDDIARKSRPSASATMNEIITVARK